MNQNGDRFVREDGRRDDICAAILRQPGRRYYVIESADGAHYTDITSPKWRSGDEMCIRDSPSVAVKCVDIRRNISGEGGLLD